MSVLIFLGLFVLIAWALSNLVNGVMQLIVLVGILLVCVIGSVIVYMRAGKTMQFILESGSF